MRVRTMLVIGLAGVLLGGVEASGQRRADKQPRKQREESLVASPLKAKRMAVPDGVRYAGEVEYAMVGDRGLFLDVYTPEKVEKALPLVVWIHGGSGRMDGVTGSVWRKVSGNGRGKEVWRRGVKA